MHEYNIYNYLNESDLESSICREERQYALYLFNIIFGLRNDQEIIDQGIKVLSVYYEVSLMRDFFEVNRRKILKEYSKEEISNNNKNIKPFNRILLDYLWEEQKNEAIDTKKLDLEFNLGENLFRHVNQWKGNEISEDVKAIFRKFMNSKPDIGILYKNNNTTKLTFIECKYESRESNKNGSQTDNQKAILKFLCDGNDTIKGGLLNYNRGSELIKNGCVKLVKFVKSGGNNIEPHYNEKLKAIIIPTSYLSPFESEEKHRRVFDVIFNSSISNVQIFEA